MDAAFGERLQAEGEALSKAFIVRRRRNEAASNRQRFPLVGDSVRRTCDAASRERRIDIRETLLIRRAPLSLRGNRLADLHDFLQQRRWIFALLAGDPGETFVALSEILLEFRRGGVLPDKLQGEIKPASTQRLGFDQICRTPGCDERIAERLVAFHEGRRRVLAAVIDRFPDFSASRYWTMASS